MLILNSITKQYNCYIMSHKSLQDIGVRQRKARLGVILENDEIVEHRDENPNFPRDER